MMKCVDVGPDDVNTLIDINNRAVPHVNRLNEADLRSILAQTCFAKKVEQGDQIAGFLLVLGPGQPYLSPNYQWFAHRFDHFAYVDRIVVHESSRGAGVGQMLYQALHDYCGQEQIGRICCEVNIRPENPGSAAFHQSWGFASVGTQETEGGTKQVDLLVKKLKP